MIALIDGDVVAYRAAASCEPTKTKQEREPLDIALFRADDVMRRILAETNSEHFRVFLGGGENFRYKLAPDYKANRRDTIRPMWLEPVREYLLLEWNAELAMGVEADDMLGINQTHDSIICSIDKDLKQVPGRHYNFVTGEFSAVDEQQGWANFYIQLLMGDRADNVQGFDGKMRQVVPKFLQPYVDRIREAEGPKDMFDIVQEIYELGDEALLVNGQLLYILRSMEDSWTFPT